MTLHRLLARAGAMALMLMVLAMNVFAQGKTVTGKVTDSKDGTPVPNASVTIKGTANGTTTDAGGNFRIVVDNNNAVLVISSVGFTEYELTVGAQTNLTISLVAAQGTLNEVVVVGYGTQRKRDLTGAVATVSSKDFVKGALQSPEQLIAGKVAGVQITPNDGRPGSGSRIRIRGGASLNASNDPLIIVDGVPLSSGAGGGNGLNLINPNDIETFTILKDPSSAAIYGSRASNGVILITTKKGKKGKLKVNFNSQVFLQVPSGKVDVLSGDQLREVINAKAPGLSSLLGKTNTDWQDEIYRNAFAQDFNLSLSGAAFDGQLPFRISGGFLNQDGLIKTDNMKRATGSLNLNPSFFNNKLKVDFNLKMSQRDAHIAPNVVGGAIGFDPTQSVLSGNSRLGGYWEWIDPGTGRPKTIAPRNPVAEIYLNDNNLKANRIITNIQLDYQLPFLKGLRVNGSYGYDYSNERGLSVTSDSLAGAYVNKGSFSPYYSENNSQVYDIYLNYVKDIKSINSRIDFMVGHGRQDFKFYSYNYPGRRRNGEILPGTQPVFINNGEPQYLLISYYSRLNYTLANKYVLTLNARTDGSSKFYEGGRWGFFPGGAVAWRISEENFLKNSKVVSDLKLRAGYGVTGQQDGIPFYGYLPNYGQSNNAAQYQLGNEYYYMLRPSAYDEKLRWETTTNINAAIDFGFFDNRLSGTLEGFFRKTKDLLSVVPVPAGANFANRLLTNIGNIESKGYEVTVNTIPVRTKDVEWSFGVNFTQAIPKITKLLADPDPNYVGVLVGSIGAEAFIQRQFVGQRPATFYVKKQIYDANGRPIQGLYEDLNRDGLSSDDERYDYKNPEARFYFGINSNINIKKFTAGFVMRGSVGNYVYNNVASSTGVLTSFYNSALGFLGNGSSDYLNTGFTQRQLFSDYYVENASFLRMDNINVGYDAGEIAKNIRLRITANVQNVFVITKYSGLDPEVATGIDGGIYPRPRTFVLGVNLDF